MGAISGLHYSVAATLLEHLFENTGTAIGLHNVGAPVAGLIAPVVATVVGFTYGWRFAIVTGAAPGVLTYVLFTTKIRHTEARRPDESMRSQVSIADVMVKLTRRSVAFTLFLAMVSMFIWQANISFLPTFLIEYRACPKHAPDSSSPHTGSAKGR